MYYTFEIDLIMAAIHLLLAHDNAWGSDVKGAISSRSEQTFDRAWNRCPIFR